MSKATKHSTAKKSAAKKPAQAKAAKGTWYYEMCQNKGIDRWITVPGYSYPTLARARADKKWVADVTGAPVTDLRVVGFTSASAKKPRARTARVAPARVTRASRLRVHDSTVKYLDPDRVTGKRQTKAPLNRSRTGYGNKIPTHWMLELDGKRWYRVYMIQWSNLGSAYIQTKSGKLYLGSYKP